MDNEDIESPKRKRKQYKSINGIYTIINKYNNKYISIIKIKMEQKV